MTPWRERLDGGSTITYIPIFPRVNRSECYTASNDSRLDHISLFCHRKPGIVSIANITIAFAGWQLRRSRGGEKWGPIIDLPPPEQSHCASHLNGVMVADEETDVLHYLVCCTEPDRNDVWVLSSTTHGRTWGAARNITEQIAMTHLVPGASFIPAIGGGIQTSSGRLIAQFYGEYCFKDASGHCKVSGSPFKPRSSGGNPETTNGHAEVNFILYSDDQGAHWKSSPVFGATGAEGAAVELFDGRTLYYNYRSDGPMVDHCPDGAAQCDTGFGANITRACGTPQTPGRPSPHHCRVAMFSTSGGTSWHDAEGRSGWYGTSLPDMPDPGCKGGLTRWEAGRMLVASNVQNHGIDSIEAGSRFNLTLSLSRDGISWPKRVVVWKGGAAYSDVRMTSDGYTAAVHFEAPWTIGAGTIVVSTLSPEWVLITLCSRALVVHRRWLTCEVSGT